MNVSKRDESPTKEFVTVNLTQDTDARIYPNWFERANGQKFYVEKLLDVHRAASLRAGGQGMRYNVRISVPDTDRMVNMYLFDDVGNWFIEVTEKGGYIVCAGDTTQR